MATAPTPLRCASLIFKTRSPTPSLFTLDRHHRLLSTTPRHPFPSQPQLPFGTGPSPPRLPKEEQELFEALQARSTGAFSTPQEPPPAPPATTGIHQSPDPTPSDRAEAGAVISGRTDFPAAASSPASDPQRPTPTPLSSPATGGVDVDVDVGGTIEARGTGSELHPNVRRGAEPEFEGDVNPRTGEVGGPKNEPLRWGSGGEWSYNGRTTDF